MLSRERRLNAAIAEYLQAEEGGRVPDRREFLDRHWYLTDGLVAFFRDEDRLKRAAWLPRSLPRGGRPAAHTAGDWLRSCALGRSCSGAV